MAENTVATTSQSSLEANPSKNYWKYMKKHTIKGTNFVRKKTSNLFWPDKYQAQSDDYGKLRSSCLTKDIIPMIRSIIPKIQISFRMEKKGKSIQTNKVALNSVIHFAPS